MKMNDIGSIFALYKEQIDSSSGDTAPYEENGRYFFSLCREALYEIARIHSAGKKVVLIPSYTCMTVASPFLEQGWTCIYYNICKDLRIDIKHIETLFNQYHPDIIVCHPYYGMDFSEPEISVLTKLKSLGCVIAVDLTQCIFSSKRYPFADYFVGSLRKWMPIPDGAFLETSCEHLHFLNNQRDCNTEFVTKQTDAMLLRGIYFESGNQEIKEISRRINKDAVSLSRNIITPHKISDLAYSIMKRENIKENEESRLSNFDVLYHQLKGNSSYQPVCKNHDELTTAPLYFTIYTNKRSELQKILAEKRIYAPVIWPIGCNDMLISDDIHFIYTHILAIPCDQRYDEHDMIKIAETINQLS